MEAPTSTYLLLAVLAPVLTGLATMALPRSAVSWRVLVALLGPVISVWCVLKHVLLFQIVAQNDAVGTAAIPWIPSLHLNITFLADGLGVFFALLVCGIGTMIVLYARAYFGPNRDDLWRFYPTLGFFTTAMMGIVLADHMLLTVLFWEMTSISSFLLIGWDRYDKRAVKLAMQAFFTTGLGGMTMFGGVLMFGAATDVWRFSDMLHWQPVFSGRVVAAFCLLLTGAATKSAQWPWHYWLPGAMAAPTPVSAFLHSATMVKAGVYLVARMYPTFHELPLWPYLILTTGAITMLLGAVVALNQHDLKRIFAYTTVSQLGLLMCTYGLGALGFEYEHGGHRATLMAIDWDISQIANHALYKAPLFIIAGAVAHVAGTRELPKLFGFWSGAGLHRKAMVLVMLLAGYALAGGPGTISFSAKELFFYAIYHVCHIHWAFQLLAAMAVLTAMCNVAIFVRLLTTLMGWRSGLVHASLGSQNSDSSNAHTQNNAHHESGFWAAMLWAPAALIVVWQYVGGLAPEVWKSLMAPLESNGNYFTITNGMPSVYALHAGVPLYMSLIAITLGVGLGVSPMMRRAIGDVHDRIYPALYWLCVNGGYRAFRLVQTGNLRHYLVFVLGAFLIGFAGSLYLDPEMLQWPRIPILEFWPGALLGVIVCATALLLPIVQRRVVRVLVLGSCGFSVVGMFLIYQAPDLALTQLMFEIISVILFVLVLRLLPDESFRTQHGRWWRVVLAASMGIAIGIMTLLAAGGPKPQTEVLGDFFTQHSYEGTDATVGRGGGGHNIVNVILVDFRGFDTLGEITVLAIAALGVWSLLPGRRSRSFALRGNAP